MKKTLVHEPTWSDLVDETKSEPFRSHSCPVCHDGAKPCKTKVVGNCGNLFARND
jgi:hypothetical protein